MIAEQSNACTVQCKTEVEKTLEGCKHNIPPKDETSMNVYNQPTDNFRDLNRKRKVLEKLEISKARKNKLELLNGIN